MLDIGPSVITLSIAKPRGIKIRSLDNTPVKRNGYRSGHTRIGLPVDYHLAKESCWNI